MCVSVRMGCGAVSQMCKERRENKDTKEWQSTYVFAIIHTRDMALYHTPHTAHIHLGWSSTAVEAGLPHTQNEPNDCTLPTTQFTWYHCASTDSASGESGNAFFIYT